jgi:hypothetical protein
MTIDGIGSARRLFDGRCQEFDGTYWAWPVDGYWDLHHAERGVQPDGSDVIEEGLPSLAAARAAARERRDFYGWLNKLEG